MQTTISRKCIYALYNTQIVTDRRPNQLQKPLQLILKMSAGKYPSPPGPITKLCVGTTLTPSLDHSN